MWHMIFSGTRTIKLIIPLNEYGHLNHLKENLHGIMGEDFVQEFPWKA